MKRILLICPGPFSKTDNDGQTLEDIFQRWDRECLAQFYIQDIAPDFDYCNNYYRVSDRGVLKYLLGKSYNPDPCCNRNDVNRSTRIDRKQIRKTPVTMLIRELLWHLSRWEFNGFYDWVKSFAPDLLFFEIGDNSYMMKFVTKLQEKLNIPLLVHNTEGFYFFEESCYKRATSFENWFYPIVHRRVLKSYAEVMRHSAYVLYSCDKLKQDFDAIFDVPSSVIYKSGNCTRRKKNRNFNGSLRISYVGNLGYSRPDAIIEVADVIKTIAPDYSVEVYGGCKTIADKKHLEEHPNIIYKGFVDFATAAQVVSDSDILLHVESALAGDDVKYGFSTKIPDSLASGNCFFMYAPDSVAGAAYLKQHVPEAVAFTREELKDKLELLIRDRELRQMVISKELKLAATNHNKVMIAKIFREIIDEITA